MCKLDDIVTVMLKDRLLHILLISTPLDHKNHTRDHFSYVVLSVEGVAVCHRIITVQKRMKR
jgi:hypothetical protein